ncbi:MAG TPA: subclass B3 metallo-beta-lactamase [Cyclobacteriaceae bacterium]
MISRKAPLLLYLLLASIPVFPQKVSEPSGNPDWSRDYEPFRVVGNLYYVGTYDLACYLITTPEGNILINTGLAASEHSIKANIEALGFKMSDTKILLITQGHFDHTGAIAAIRKSTAAKLMVNEPDGKVMSDGGKSDYAFGGYVSSFVPAPPDQLLHDRDTIKLGGMNIVMLGHPGHTRGSCSYLFDVKDGSKTYKVLVANMPTIVIDRKFPDVKEYPTIEKDYANTFKAMKDIQFDLWVASHASQFGLHKKRKPGDAYNPSVFKDRAGYDKGLSELESEYNEKVKKD